MVSDLDNSHEFYGGVLGLTTDASCAFVCGRVTIQLRRESAIGLVKSLNRMQRLMGDWAVFHVTDIETTAARLENRGVRFPSGIEDSQSGRIAYFNDPDGHSLNLWQPPGEPTEMNYFPVLTRLINRRRLV
jgi:predicted enzyme related to lactoylglutathione lyase